MLTVLKYNKQFLKKIMVFELLEEKINNQVHI
jgi:hypothetical protein